MSKYSNRAMLSLLNMTHEMYRKKIEISRITKTCALLMMSGLSPYDISKEILNSCLESQNDDGGFVGNTDTLWNIKFLSFFPQYNTERTAALKWLIANNGEEPGYGRSKRDMHRIPVTGLALYLLPELGNEENLRWLEKTWESEINSLTYKAAYSLLAFSACGYRTQIEKMVEDTANWIVSQQEESGGFAPWHLHPVGPNVYCTSVALLALLAMNDKRFDHAIIKAYRFLCNTQIRSGIWPYHEIEDGAAWGLLALTETEQYLGDRI